MFEFWWFSSSPSMGKRSIPSKSLTVVPAGGFEERQGVRLRQKTLFSFFSFKKRKKVKSGGIWWIFFLPTLITGLLSDRSLSKSYKSEGGG